MRLYAILGLLLIMAGLTAWAFSEKAGRISAQRERDRATAEKAQCKSELIAERATSTKYRTLNDQSAKKAEESRLRQIQAEDTARALIDELRAEEARSEPEPVPEPQPGASPPSCSYQLPSDWRRRLQNDIPIRRPEANPAAAGQRGNDAVP